MKQAHVISRGLGIPLPTATYPGAPMVDSEESLRGKVVSHLFPGIVAGLTSSSSGTPTSIAVESSDVWRVVYKGTLDQVQDYFEDRLWSDGLPFVPPTRDRVEAFLRCTDRSAETVLGVLPQEGRAATVLSVAVNGVMAGCRPEYMPVLIAAVEAVSDPYFKLEEAGSTTGWEPVVIVSGPIAAELGFHHGQGVQRIGRRANSSVGRFLRLYFRNVCGYRIPPGAGDKGSIASNFLVALAESESFAHQIGWTTFAEDLGFSSEENVVTVQSVVCVSSPVYSSGTAAVEHARLLVDVIGGAFRYWSHSTLKVGYWHPLIIIGPSIARAIAAEWSKDKLREFFRREATIPASVAQHYCRHTSGMELDFTKLVHDGILSSEYTASDDPDRPLKMVMRAEDIGILVAGDEGRNQSRGYMGNHMHGARTSRRIELPKAWNSIPKHVSKFDEAESKR